MYWKSHSHLFYGRSPHCSSLIFRAIHRKLGTRVAIVEVPHGIVTLLFLQQCWAPSEPDGCHPWFWVRHGKHTVHLKHAGDAAGAHHTPPCVRPWFLCTCPWPLLFPSVRLSGSPDNPPVPPCLTPRCVHALHFALYSFPQFCILQRLKCEKAVKMLEVRNALLLWLSFSPCGLPKVQPTRFSTLPSSLLYHCPLNIPETLEYKACAWLRCVHLVPTPFPQVFLPSSTRVQVVLEFMAGGDLQQRIEKKRVIHHLDAR